MRHQLLITKEIEKKFKNHPFESQSEKEFDADVLVKFFNPCGDGTWLITEAEKQSDGDWLMFGYFHILRWEWGFVSLSELSKMQFGYFHIERDKYAKGTVKENI